MGVEATEDLAAVTDANLQRFGAIVLLSTTGEFLEAEQLGALQRFVRNGGGSVGVHAAADALYDVDWYGGLIGAWFDSHPDIQTAAVHVEDQAHASVAGLPEPWVRSDEWYSFRSNPRDAGVEVLLTLDEGSYQGGTMGADHPIAWRHQYDGGRAWYTAGGHTSESFSEPLFVDHLTAGILWALGR